MPLSNLINVSSVRAGFASSNLEAIRDVVRRNNERHGLTAMVLYAGGSFMQALEGEAEDIETTFLAIQKDSRHYGVVVLEQGPIAARSFSNWRMGFRTLDIADGEAHPGSTPFFANGFDVASIGARKGTALDLLTVFRETNH